MKIKGLFLLLPITFLYSLQSNAQSRFSVDVYAGTPFGIMTIPNKFGQVSGISFRVSLSNRWSIAAGADVGEIHGFQSKLDPIELIPTYRNMQFSNHYVAANGNIQYNLSSHEAFRGISRKINFYMMIGGSLMQGDVKSQIFLNPSLSYTGIFYLGQGGFIARYYLNSMMDLQGSILGNISESPWLDGLGGAYQPDHFVSFLIGLNIKVGAVRRDHIDWNNLNSSRGRKRFGRNLSKLKCTVF